MAPDKQHAYQLIDQLDAGQLAAVVHLLQVMTDPVARALANAPVDEQPLSEETIKALDASREWLKHNPGIPHEQVLSELGITPEEISRFKKST
jgi:hypothetical protein